MSLQYDDIGNRYNDIKSTPAFEVEKATFLNALGDIVGSKVLDLACGAGFYSSILLDNGAASVIGYDISPEMVKHARNNVPNTSNVEFHVKDCTKALEVPGAKHQFDIVLAAWCLNYASNEAELLTMCQNIATNLTPGGHFIGILPNLELDMTIPLDPRYGVTVESIGEVKDGFKCKLTAFTEPIMEFQTYHLTQEVYYRCFRNAGLKNIEVSKLVFPSDKRLRDGYWEEYIRRPHLQVTTATVN